MYKLLKISLDGQWQVLVQGDYSACRRALDNVVSLIAASYNDQVLNEGRDSVVSRKAFYVIKEVTK